MSRRRTKVLFVIGISTAPLCFSQHQHEHALVTSGTQRQLQGSVNGALSPDSIPDTVAYRLFLKVLLNAPGSPAEVLERRHAILRAAKLSQQDYGEVTHVVEAFGRAMAQHSDDYRTAETKPGGMDEQSATFFMKQKDRIAEDARANLESYLSADGVKRLHALIMSEKANMTAIVAPAMPTSGAAQ